MKRAFLGFTILAALVLACAGTTLAVPIGISEGSSIFAEYSDFWYEDFLIGGGYAFNESTAIGIFCSPDWEDWFGFYGKIASGPIRVDLEIITDLDNYEAVLSGLYVIDQDALALGVGCGSTFWDGGGFDDLFVKATAEIKLDAIAVYGAVLYWPDWEEGSYYVGMSYTF